MTVKNDRLVGISSRDQLKSVYRLVYGQNVLAVKKRQFEEREVTAAHTCAPTFIWSRLLPKLFIHAQDVDQKND